MRAVKSSNISDIDYDAANRVLSVQFSNGGKYAYAGVEQKDYDALVAADDDPDVSFGSYFHRNIKSRFEGKKVNE